MLKKLLFSTTLTVLAATVAFSQAQATTKGSSSSSSKTSVSKGDRELISSGTIVNAELMNSIDVRKSKVGDEVLLKTTKAIKENGDTVVAKGTTLVGRITEIQQRTKDNAQSRVGMLIDRIHGKDLNAPISVSILSMTAARATAAAGDTFADAGLMSNSGGSVQSSGSNGGSGGGLLSGVGNTVGGVVNTTSNVVGGVTQTATNTVGGVTQTAGNTVGGVGRTVNGIQISQAMGGSASGSTSFSAQHKDVRIEKGATFNVQFNNSVSN
jgi:hypothetical protein